MACDNAHPLIKTRPGIDNVQISPYHFADMVKNASNDVGNPPNGALWRVALVVVIAVSLFGSSALCSQSFLHQTLETPCVTSTIARLQGSSPQGKQRSLSALLSNPRLHAPFPFP